MSNQNIMVVLTANTSQFSTAMARVQAQMNATASNIKRSLDGTEGDANKSTNGISGSFKKMGQNISNVMAGVRTALFSGLITSLLAVEPLVAVIGTGAMAMGSAMASAGVGFIGFGAVATGVLGKVFTATNKTFQNLDKQQQIAYKALQNFKTFWGGFTKQFEAPVVDMFSQSLGILKTVLTAMQPAIQGTMKAMSGLLADLKTSLGTPDMQKFFQWVGSTAGTYVTDFGKIFGNTFKGIINLFMAFSPLANMVVNGLLSMTQAFANWSSTLSASQGFQQFIAYVSANTPIAIGFISGLLKTIGNLLVILAPIGSAVLGVLNNLVNGLANVTGQIKNALNIGDPNQIVASIGQIIPTILQILLGGMPSLIQRGAEIINSVASGMGQSVAQLTTTVVSIISNIITSFAQALPMILNTGMEILLGLLQGIISVLPQVLANLTTVAQSLCTSFVQLIAGNLPTIITMGLGILMALINGIVTNLPLIIQTVFTMITALVNTILTNLPTIINAGIQILNALINGIITMLPKITSMVITLITQLLNAIVAHLPQIIDAGVKLLNSLINGIMKMLPSLINSAVKLVNTLLTQILNHLPQIINAGMKLLNALVTGILNNLPMLIQMALELILKLAGAIISHLPQIISAGIKIIVALAGALISAIPKIVATIPKIISAIKNAFSSVNWGSVGSNIMKGIGNGLSGMLGWLKGKAENIATGLLNSAKHALGIHSPSRVFRDEVGKYIPQGIAVGIQNEGKVANDAVTAMSKSLVLTGSNLNVSSQISHNIPSLSTANTTQSDSSEKQYTFTIPVSVDGKVVAKATAQYMQSELDRLTKQNNRMGGIV